MNRTFLTSKFSYRSWREGVGKDADRNWDLESLGHFLQKEHWHIL